MPGRGANNNNNGGNNAGRGKKQNGGNQTQKKKNNNNNQKKCTKCNKIGHLFDDCRSSNGDAMHIDSEGGTPTKCWQCGLHGHRSDECPTARGESNTGQNNANNNGGSKFCDFHNNSSHGNADCKDPRNPQGPSFKGDNSKGGNSKGDGSKGAARGGFTTGHNLYSDWDRVDTTSQQPYCPLCNAGHWERDCINKGVVDVRYSPQSCWKCHLRGHTGDDCRNPAKDACDKCRKSGHATAFCKDTSAGTEMRGRLYEQTAGRAAAANLSRFEWDPVKTRMQLSPLQIEQQWQKQQLEFALINGITVTDDDRKTMRERLARAGAQGPQNMQWQTPATSNVNIPFGAQTSRPVHGPFAAQSTGAAYLQFPTAAKDFVAAAAVNSMDFSGLAHLPAAAQHFVSKCVYEAAIAKQGERERRVHAHCELSTRMYRKENYAQWIHQHDGELLQRRILGPDKYHTQLKLRMGLGLQLWRDPQAMRAIAQKQKPSCNTCFRSGEFWDGLMREIPVQADVLELRDFQDWGVFVAFECKCCNKAASYSFVSRPSCELGSECDMAGC
ncbi:hypothetical protein LTR36_007964 [Oleoguttula mirabilis]|uniref:CCHC-type domain-containing protein n=1 Tax=Oleoguttula mirabilis TaxID=1507867 RepID=A0AAV9J997_9PEZI|nr:hypothetical protein LTR36_007964 [Oleoguttula mirabilis]